MTPGGGTGLRPRTALVVPERKSNQHTMINWRRIAVSAAALTGAACALSAGAFAQATVPPAGGDTPPVVIDDAIPQAAPGEIIHSWALAPAGSLDPNQAGNRADLSYTADPGAVINDGVTLFNYGTEQLTFRVYGVDAFNTETGAIDVTLGTDDPTNAGSWVTMAQEYITLPAGDQATIPFTLTIPENAAPGDYRGAILASNQARSTGNDQQVVVLDRRTGTNMYIRVNGPLSAELAIENMSTDYHGSLHPLAGKATVSYTIVNRGNVSLSGTAQVSVGGPLKLGKQTLPPSDFPTLLPGGSAPITVELDQVPALGWVTSEVTLTPEGQDVQIESLSRTSTTIAMPIVILLGLLALLLGALAIRAYRRHQQSDDHPQADLIDPSIVELDADRAESLPT